MLKNGQRNTLRGFWRFGGVKGMSEEDNVRDLVERTVRQVLEAEMASFLDPGTTSATVPNSVC